MKEFWDDRFSNEEYYYGKEPNTFFKTAIDELKPGKLFLPGEGEGRNAVYAARLGWDVLAVDFSEAGKKKALRFASDSNVIIRYDTSDLLKYKTSESFDAIAVIFVHFRQDARKLFFHQLRSSLKTGGVLIVELFEKKQIKNSSGGPKDVNMLVTINELHEEFRNLDIRMLRSETIFLAEGENHAGNAEVVRMIAIKQF